MSADIIFRADGNADIGMGHLMRCLSIAREVAGRGRVLFWCANETSAAQVRRQGYTAVALGTDYRDMLPELSRLEGLHPPGQRGTAVILVDSYYADTAYLRALREYGRVYLLEDMPGHARGAGDCPVDGVINYNAFADEGMYREIYGQCKRYIGPAYIPLRPQFAGRDYRVRERVEQILVTTGGGDAENIAGRILARLEGSGYITHVVSGPCNSHAGQLAAYAADHPRVRVHRQVRDMAGLMARCDLAVTAGGTTVYELCALGVPFVCFSCAGNQEALADYAEEKGIGRNAGRYHVDPAQTLENIGRLTRETAGDWQLRGSMSGRAVRLVDGAGARRLADALLDAVR